jgi:site-specific recombinase XerD
MNGVPARPIQALAGHQSLMTTQRYMHLTPSGIQDGIRALEQRPTFRTGDNLETANANV